MRRSSARFAMMRAMIPLTRPSLGDEETQAIARVLSSGWLVQGPEVARFEAALAERCGRKHAIAVSSGTSALLIAMRALGIGAGDEVLCPALTWPSPANVAKVLGASVIPVDVDPGSWNIAPQAVKDARSTDTKAAVIIDQFGFPADHSGLREALDGLLVIEDAACAIGSTLGGNACGQFGLIACLSFHPRKIVTTGEGGACLTDDDGLADALRMLRNHGQRGPGEFGAAAGNHRLTEMGAAMGLVQLTRLDEIVEGRAQWAAQIKHGIAQALKDEPSLLPAFQSPVQGAAPNYQTLGMLLPRSLCERGSWPEIRTRVMDRAKALGVQLGALSYGVHHIESIVGERRFACPVTDDILDRGMTLPLYPQMTKHEADTVAQVVSQCITEVARGAA